MLHILLPVSDTRGNRLVSLTPAPPAEEGGSLAVIVARWDGRILIAVDGWRMQWELPYGVVGRASGGGATVREAAVSELDLLLGADVDPSAFVFVGSAVIELGRQRSTHLAGVFVVDVVDPGRGTDGLQWETPQSMVATAAGPSRAIAEWATARAV